MTTQDKIASIIESQYNGYRGAVFWGLKGLHQKIRKREGDEKFLEILNKWTRENPKPVYSPMLYPEILEDCLNLTKDTVSTLLQIKQKRKAMTDKKQITDEMVKNFIAQEHAPVNIPYVIERWDEFKASHSSSSSSEKIEKDWEIVSYYSELGTTVLTKNNDGTFGPFFAKGSDLQLSSLFSIHSVRRLSDGEVFSIGDEIAWGDAGTYRKTILSFRVNTERENRLEFEYTAGVAGNQFCDFLNAVRLHKKAPIPEEKPIKKKDWEIVEFEHRNCPDNPQLNYISNGAGYVTKDNKSCMVKSLEWMITRPFLKIKSVKRNTDGLTFSVGDKIEQEHLSPKIITNFQVSENTIIVLFENNGSYWEYLNDLIGHAKSLFKTEDGKEVFEGDDFWKVHHQTFEVTKCKAQPALPRKDPIRSFGSEQAATEYCLLNRPCLSVNDVLGLDLDIVVKYDGPKLPSQEVDLIVFKPESLKQLASYKIKGGE